MRLSFGNARDRRQAFDARWKNGRCRAPAERSFYTHDLNKNSALPFTFSWVPRRGCPKPRDQQRRFAVGIERERPTFGL